MTEMFHVDQIVAEAVARMFKGLPAGRIPYLWETTFGFLRFGKDESGNWVIIPDSRANEKILALAEEVAERIGVKVALS